MCASQDQGSASGTGMGGGCGYQKILTRISSLQSMVTSLRVQYSGGRGSTVLEFLVSLYYSLKEVSLVFLFVCLFVCFVFEMGFLCVALAIPELRDLPASASQVL